MKRRLFIAIGILLVFGAVRLPFERHLDKLQRAEGFRTTALNLSLREQIGQMGFVAALSGFRSLVAAYLWIEANSAWERTEWGRMAGLFKTVTTLAPKSILYWDMSDWHMGWNASVAAREDGTQPSEFLRKRAERQYWDLGRSIFEDGVRNNPDSARLLQSLGDLYRLKYEDHCKAAEVYAEAASKPDARPYLKRLAAYELAKCPGKEKEAYAELMRLYNLGESERTPSLIRDIKELEEKLGIPADQRIKETNGQPHS